MLAIICNFQFDFQFNFSNCRHFSLSLSARNIYKIRREFVFIDA